MDAEQVADDSPALGDALPSIIENPQDLYGSPLPDPQNPSSTWSHSH